MRVVEGYATLRRSEDKSNSEPDDLEKQSVFQYFGSVWSRVKCLRFRKKKGTVRSLHAEDDSSHWTDGLSLRAKGFGALFLINMIFIAVAIGLSTKYDNQPGSFINGAVIYEGSCTLTGRWSTALHLIINVVSAGMLAISTYCMQVLVAPTRQDIDKYHAQKRWLDIGCISWRNILALDKYRLSLLMILGITATPFHLMYNSIVFESLGTNEYVFILGPGDLDSHNIKNLTTPELEQCFPIPIFAESFNSTTWGEFSSSIAAENFDRLTTHECYAFMQKMHPSGVTALLGLTDDLSVTDGGNAAFMVTDIQGGAPDTRVNSFHGPQPNESTAEILGDVFSKPTFTLSVPTGNGGFYMGVQNMSNLNTTECANEGGDILVCMSAASALFDTYGDDKFPTRQEMEQEVAARGDGTIQIHGPSVSCISEYVLTNQVYPEYFNPTSHKINGCLAVKGEENCQLLYSPPICIVIIFSMIAKFVVILLTMRGGRSRKTPLLAIGDAISSFMEHTDSTTEGFCWAAESDFRQGKWNKPTVSRLVQDPSTTENSLVMPPKQKVITFARIQRRKRWVQVPSLMQWLITMALCIGCIICGSWFLEQEIAQPNQNNKYKADDFTQTNRLTTQLLHEWWNAEIRTDHYLLVFKELNFEVSVLSSVIVANTPQLAITIAYYFYNGLLTNMVAGAEYSSYGATQKPLRVSAPVKGSEQLPTYLLNMPYQYATPIILLDIALHWLVSKSLYYITMIPYGSQGQTSGCIYQGCAVRSLGFSPLALFVAILVGSLMVCILLVLSMRRLNSEIPVTRSCSAAISAACHVPSQEDSESAVLGKLQWGETPPPAWVLDWFGVIEDRKGHCSFTSWHIEEPSFQNFYA